MNPDEFLTLAIKLSSSSGEAERRSAVSRAYYGAFHQAKVLLEACEITIPNSENIHSVIVRCLQHSGDMEIEVAGRKLDSLRSERNDADYRLADRRFQNPKFIQIQVTSARQVSDAVAQALQILQVSAV